MLGLSGWNSHQTSKYIQNQGIRRQQRRLPKRIYLWSGAWGIALIFLEIETPTMKLPIIYHTWSLKGETEKHLVLLLFKHMIAEHSHPGCGFKRWCVWKGPARKPVQPNAGLLSADSPASRGLSHARWGSSPRGLEQVCVVHTLTCVETRSLLRPSPVPS